MLSWITGTAKSDTTKAKQVERNGISSPEPQAVVAYPRHAESKGVVSVGRTNSVTYAARDKKHGVELVCSAPVGSKHAAKVLELCNHIYSNGARDLKSARRQITTTQACRAIEQRHTIDNISISDDEVEDEEEPEIIERAPRTTGPSAANDIESAARSVQYESQHHHTVQDPASKRAYERVRHAPEPTPQCAPSAKSRYYTTPSAGSVSDLSDKGSTVVVTEGEPRLSASQMSRHQPEPQLQVHHQGYRHDSGTQTTYRVHSQKGELLVSAPNGSGEARLFDEVATRAGGRDYVSDSPV